MITQRFWTKGYDVIGFMHSSSNQYKIRTPPPPSRKENSVLTILLVRTPLESRCFHRVRLGKHQGSRENKTNCFPRDLTLSVHCSRAKPRQKKQKQNKKRANLFVCLFLLLLLLLLLIRSIDLDAIFIAAPVQHYSIINQSFAFSPGQIYVLYQCMMFHFQCIRGCMCSYKNPQSCYRKDCHHGYERCSYTH